ncbi:MAG: hypothetical protein IT336_07640 [Thermomicrobiales bacterium]|nr:hypothetical protein [Thermomicrobiales bacterium]
MLGRRRQGDLDAEAFDHGHHAADRFVGRRKEGGVGPGDRLAGGCPVDEVGEVAVWAARALLRASLADAQSRG